MLKLQDEEVGRSLSIRHEGKDFFVLHITGKYEGTKFSLDLSTVRKILDFVKRSMKISENTEAEILAQFKADLAKEQQDGSSGDS